MKSSPRSSRLRRRTSALLAGLVSAALVLSGCSVYDAPLPGGAKTGDNPMTIKVMFRDVLDLVPQSTVRVNDVTVGKVTKVDLKGYVAEVTVEIPGTSSCRTTPARRSGRPASSARSSSSSASRGTPAPASWRTATRSAWTAPVATPRSKRSSARSRCCSTVAASASSRRSSPS